MVGLDRLISRAAENARAIANHRGVLVAISGIDASGKGFVARQLAAGLGDAGCSVALISADDWLVPAEKRFSQENAGEHFYRNAVAFDEMFRRLVLPLRSRRSVKIGAVVTRLPEDVQVQHVYDFKDVDVIVLEGVFLLSRLLRCNYDLTCWIDCSFETALTRALARNQEGLPPELIVRDYKGIYFPAQMVHFKMDDPRSAADVICNNDSALPTEMPILL